MPFQDFYDETDFYETACLCAGRVQNIPHLARIASGVVPLETNVKDRLAIRVEVVLCFWAAYCSRRLVCGCLLHTQTLYSIKWRYGIGNWRKNNVRKCL